MNVGVQDRAHVDCRNRRTLRPRVREERSNRVVQPLRLFEHDVHQLRLIAGERQFLTQHLDRSRHRRQRVADLVRDAGRHLAHGREPLLHADVAFELLDRGHVLESLRDVLEPDVVAHPVATSCSTCVPHANTCFARVR